MAIPDMLFTVVATVAFRGFGEADRFLAWALDRLVGEMPTGAGDVTPISRGNWMGPWRGVFGFPTLTARNSN